MIITKVLKNFGHFSLEFSKKFRSKYFQSTLLQHARDPLSPMIYSPLLVFLCDLIHSMFVVPNYFGGLQYQ